MAQKSGAAMSTCALSLALGLSASHTLVPPTPGPVLAAAQLDANLGLVLGLGACVAVTASCAGVAFAASVAPRLVPDTALAPMLPTVDATGDGSPENGSASQVLTVLRVCVGWQRAHLCGSVCGCARVCVRVWLYVAVCGCDCMRGCVTCAPSPSETAGE